MDSMADLMRKLGWIAWCIAVIGWFASPIISQLVNKLFVYLEFDPSTKLKELEIHTIPMLKQTLDDVEEQMVLRAAEDKGSQSNLKILENMHKVLKSALYEAEDILDLLDYRRIEKGIYLGEDGSRRWVEHKLDAVCAWIGRCKGSWFGRWLHVNLTTVLKRAQSMTRQGKFLIQGWRHWGPNFDVFCSPRAVLQCVQSWYQQLRQRFRSAVLQRAQSWYQQLLLQFRSAVAVLQWAQSWYQHLHQHRPGVLPVSRPVSQPPPLESGGSVFVPADPTRRPAEEIVDEEEITEETQVVEGEAEIEEELEETKNAEESREREVGETSEEDIEDDKKGKEIVEEIHRSGALLPVSGPAPQPPGFGSTGSEFVPVNRTHRPAEEMEETQVQEGEAEAVQDGEGGAMLEAIEEESCEGGEAGETSEEQIEEHDEEGKEVKPTCLSILRDCVRSMLTQVVKAYSYRDWLRGIVGIKSDKDDDSAAELVPITERRSLMIRIKRIEDILTDSKKSDLLNDKNNSNSRTDKDADKESIKKSTKVSSSERKEIDDMHKNIEQKVFGREEDRERISRRLREGSDADAASSSTSKPYSVIGIYGIPGSGKSTLAQYVYDYEKEAGHFDLVMFINVTKAFMVGGIFRDMLEQITHSRPPNDEGLKSLQTKLQQKLKGKRFLLVLDDVWVNDENQKERDILLDTLRAALRGSRILVTSQKTGAAAALGDQEQISIPDLEEGIYLSLFMHHALPDASADDGEYERIGRKIANRLGRSPIAAVTVGKQLQRNKSISFWETTANLDVLNKTMGALWWSYQQLGVDVRRCFTYCSIYPKGYGIERDEMVRMWVAQGFVSTRSNAAEELEDVGQRYCEELLTFSFLKEEGKKFFTNTRLHELEERKQGEKNFMKTKIFRIHDLLHELAERVSGNEFYRIGLNGFPKGFPQGVHNLSIDTNNVAEIVEKIPNLGNLRTLIINDDSCAEHLVINNLEKFLGRLFKRLRKVRVLIIKLNYGRYKESVSVPRSIYQMKHLRYLCFSFCVRGLSLPSTFSKLYHVQVINILSPSASYIEPMTYLIGLRHVPGNLPCPIRNIGRLTSLQTLPIFVVKKGQEYGLKQLKHLNKLRGTLWIEGLETVGSKEEALEAHLIHKERLRRLLLEFGWGRRFAPEVEAEVLEGLCPPKDLQELRIDRYWGSRYPSWMLSRGHLATPKHLHSLELCFCSQLAYIPEDVELFIYLSELTIFACHWDSLPRNMERLQSLQTLQILSCRNLELLPKLPVQSLKKIRISSCNVLSMTCKEVGHENWCKIQQIPEKDID